MESKQLKGPFCQSCGMPMENEEVLGTKADGSKNKDYCQYCYKNGKFLDPNITLEQMIDLVAGFMAKELNIPGNQAKEIAKESIPQLKRWRGWILEK